MDNIFLFFIFVIPILFSFFVIVSYSFYTKIKHKNNLIELLASTNSKIIDKNRVDFSVKTDNWLAKKLKFAGFTTNSVEYIFILICLAFGFLSSFFIYFITNSKLIFIFTFFIFFFIYNYIFIFIFIFHMFII